MEQDSLLPVEILLFQAAEARVCVLPGLIMKLVCVQTLFLLAKLTS